MTALVDLLRRLHHEPVRRGKQFERICQWFLTQDPVYAHELRRVWLWDEWPGRWGADAGIDLVAEDRRGHLWAIQAKAYDPATTITKRDVDTFLAESGRPEFSFRMVIATTNLIGRTAKRTIQGQEKQASVLLLGDLEAAEVDWPMSPSELRAQRRQPKTARPHQLEAIDKVVEGFHGVDRGQLIMACGTGKTLTALFINEKLAAERTLVLLPSLSLLGQTLREWTANATVGFEFLPVCSDKTVADPDAAVTTTSDLGFPVTTDAAEIAAFLRKRSGPRVVFATYQSSAEIAKAFQLGRVPAFDLVIADEAHRCAGPVSSSFGTVLNSDAIRGRRRLFMTATPRYFTGRVVREAKEVDFEVASMDDEATFGPEFHRLGFAEAIERELLTDYRVVVVGVDDATYREWAERGQFVTMDGTTVTNARTLAGQIGLAKAMRRYDLRRTISFHSRVRRAHEFAQTLPEVIAWMPARQRPNGQLWADHASGEMPAGQRHVLLQHLGRISPGERGLLANARCLAEGVDVPTLDCVAFIDPRRSEVDIVQAVGRAIRLAPDKSVGTIVIPVFVDASEDAATALDDSAFKPVWDVIKALRSHDEQLGAELDELRRELGARGQRPRLPDKIHLDLPARISRDFARAFDVRLVEQSTTDWELGFGVLQRFVELHGHARVAFDYVLDGYRLGGWVNAQRTKFIKGNLNVEHERRLQEVSGWTWDPNTDKWEEAFDRLLRYVEHNGNTRVPRSHRIDGYLLGAWLGAQRRKHANGTLDADRQRRLAQLPSWSWDPEVDRWEEAFDRLLRYVERNGNARVPQSYKIDGLSLGAWLVTQRRKYANGTLDADRQRRLERLPGWSWDPYTDQWEEGFNRLLSFVERNGHARVPASYILDGYQLGPWLNTQRTNYGTGTLDAARQQRLEQLPGWLWEPHADKWEEGFNQLLTYIERNGHTRIPDSYILDGYKLGSWAKTQRTKYRKGTLEVDRQHRLQELASWIWDPFSDQWEEGFNRLLLYVERNGHARVAPKCIFEGYQLGSWVARQRTNQVKNTLEADRGRRLEGLPGWTWTPRADKWEEGFNQLLTYVERNGSARVPHAYVVDGYKLGSWLNTQRTIYGRGALDVDRQQRLEQLTGWSWDPNADKWEEGFNRLLTYVAQYGDALVPKSYTVDGYQLGSWVNTQRGFYAKGTLDVGRQQRLERLPGWVWGALAARWEEAFSQLLLYVESNRSALVPRDYTLEGFALGEWVRRQRRMHVKGALDPNRQQRLQQLPSW